jgi:tetratricopeptide (TPR) repeat protein
MSPIDSASRRRFFKMGGICTVLALLVQLIYFQTLTFDFVNIDDNEYVYDNGFVNSGLTLFNFLWALGATHACNWHPLTWMSHMLDVECFGLAWPGGHHYSSVLIHTATAAMLFLALARMTGAVWASAVVAALFAVHPLRAESVAWVAERKDVLSGFFFAATLFAYAGFVRRPTARRYCLVVAVYLLGLMAKPMLVTMPFLLLLLDYWPLRRPRTADAPSLGRLLAEKSPLLAMAAAAAALTVFAQDAAMQSTDQFPLAARLGNAAISYLAYIRQLFWPSGLALLYKLPAAGLPWWQALVAGAALAGITVAAIAVRGRRPYLLVGWLWYLGMLVPVIGLLQVGLQARADRYTYLPQIGLVLALVWWVADLTAQWKHQRPILAAAAISLIVVLSWCAREQASYWRDGVTLYTRALNCTEDNQTAHCNLGNCLRRMGRNEEAAEHYREVLKLNPRDTMCWIGLSNVLKKLGRDQEANVCLEKARALNIGSVHNPIDLEP